MRSLSWKQIPHLLFSTDVLRSYLSSKPLFPADLVNALQDGEATMISSQFPGNFSAGLDLVNIALQRDSRDVLRLLLPPGAMDAPPADPRYAKQCLPYAAKIMIEIGQAPS